MPTLCLCGSQLAFSDCCQPYLSAQSYPATPEQLMRSRYSAFVQRNASYLIDTHAASTRPQGLYEQLQRSFATTTWLSLHIVDAPAPSAESGQVEFVAFFREQGKAALEQIHERSEFIFTDQRWVYHSGQHLPALKIQRNAPCPCGSGKKHKKCCAGSA